MKTYLRNQATGKTEVITIAEDPWAYAYGLALLGMVLALALTPIYFLFIAN